VRPPLFLTLIGLLHNASIALMGLLYRIDGLGLLFLVLGRIDGSYLIILLVPSSFLS